MTYLLPCPFCGASKTVLHDNTPNIGVWVSCTSCGLECPTETDITVDQAIAYWNTRAPQCVAHAQTVRDSDTDVRQKPHPCPLDHVAGMCIWPDCHCSSEPLNFFNENVDAWGAAEWFNRLATAVRQQDAAVRANNDVVAEISRNVAASSAMRLVRDYEQQVSAALSLLSTKSKVTANLVEVTQAETVELINLADRDNVLPLRFGGNRIWLDLDVATNKFMDHLKKIRRSQSLSFTQSGGGK